MSNLRKENQRQKVLLDNLACLRLQANLSVLDEKMEENKPLEKEERKGFLASVEGVITDAKNAVRESKNARIEKKKSEMQEALQQVRDEILQKKAEYTCDLPKLKKLMEKHLKKDGSGLKKIELIVLAVMDERGGADAELAYPDFAKIFDCSIGYIHSLFEAFCDNLNALQKNGAERLRGKLLQGLDEAVAFAGVSLELENTAVWSAWKKQKRTLRKDRAWKNLSEDERAWEFALRLAQIQTTEKSEEKWKVLVDNLLTLADERRGDAEYLWIAEDCDDEACKGQIALCDLCIARMKELSLKA